MSGEGSRARWKTPIAGLCIALVVAGCAASPPSIAIPRIQATQLAPLQAGASGQRYRLSLLVDNQNPEPLPIKEVRFTMRITGQGVITARHAMLVTVEALDRQTLQVEVDGDVLPSLSQLRAAAAPGNTLPYEIYGNITLDRAFQNTLPFTATGAVTLSASER